MPGSTKDIISGAVLFILSLIMFVYSFSIRQVFPMGVSSGFFPKIVAVFLAVVSVFIVIKGLRNRAREKEPETKTDEKKAAHVVVMTLCLLAFYVSFLQTLGFILTTFIFLVCQFAVLAAKEQRNWFAFVVLAAVVSFGTYYAFYNLFHLILPIGIFG